MADPDRDIPPESRLLVETREGGRCFRCSGRGTDWHHRRSRRVRAEHRHCACNGVLLCRTCHSWAHSEVDEAKAVGLIVSQWVDEPFLVPLHNVPWAWWQVLCNGDYRPLTQRHIVTDGFGGYVISDPPAGAADEAPEVE